jgi:hypothetical protein
MECVVDPLDDDKSQAGDVIIASIPDGANGNCFLVTLRGVGSFSGATASAGVVQLMGLNRADTSSLNPCVYCFTGGTPTTASSSPTAAATYFSSDTDTILAPIIISTSKIRLISAGMKINVTSSTDTSSGTLIPYLCSSSLMAGSGAYNTYGTALTERLQPTFTVKEGVTIRRRFDTQFNSFYTPAVAPYSSGNTVSAVGNMPAVLFTGLASTTTLQIEFIMHYEVRVAVPHPFPVVQPKAEPDFGSLAQWTNAFPLVTKGHSFIGLASILAKGLVRGTATALGMGPIGEGLITAGEALAKPLLGILRKKDSQKQPKSAPQGKRAAQPQVLRYVPKAQRKGPRRPAGRPPAR